MSVKTDLPTASKISRALSCRAYPFLPHTGSEAGMAAERGSAIHKFVALAMLHGRGVAQERMRFSEYREICENIDIPMIVGGAHIYGVEISWGLDPVKKTIREVGRMLERRYGEPVEGEYIGTVDHVLVDRDRGEIIVGEIKTGRPENVEELPGNHQVRFLSLCAMIWAEKGQLEGIFDRPPSIVGRLIFIDPDSGHADIEEVTYSPEELMSFCNTLIAHAKLSVMETERVRLYNIIPAPQPSRKNCAYCEAFWHCPAQFRLAQEMSKSIHTPIPGDNEIEESLARVDTMTAGEMRLLMNTLRSFDKLSAEVWERIKRRASESPVDLGNGKFYGKIASTSTEIDIDKAMPLLRARFGAEAEDLMNRRIPKTRLQALCQDRGIDPKVVFDELEAFGALNRKQTSRMQETKNPEKKMLPG